jgi:glutamate dehydrogenase
MYIDTKKTVAKLSREIGRSKKSALFNLSWLLKHMHPYFFITFGPEKDALLNLIMNLQTLGENHQVVLRDTDEKLIIATINKPGTLFKTLDSIKDKEIIYSEMIHSNTFLPGQEGELELQKFHFRTDKEK